MSLIGEALKRARQEAAYQEAARDGRTWGPPPVYTAPKRRIWPLVAAGVAAGALLVGGVGGGVYWAVTRDGKTDREAEVAAGTQGPGGPGTQAPGSVPPGATPVVEELDPALAPETPPPPAGTPEAAPPASLPGDPALQPVPQEPAARPQAPETLPETLPVPRQERSSVAVEIVPPAGRAPAETRPAPGPEPAAPAAPAQPQGGAQENRPDPQAEAPASAPPASPQGPAAAAETAPAAPAGSTGGDEPAAAAPAGEVQTYVGSAPLPDGSRLELTGIAFSQDQPVALINGRVMGVGEGIQGYTLVRIEDGQVVLRGRGTTLLLRVQ